MKALTLMQPWATLVAIGVKRWETRSWQTAYRGPLAIHAAAAFPRAARAPCETPAFRYALRGLALPLPRGCVIATCDLVGIATTGALVDQFEMLDVEPSDCLLSQFQFGDFSRGRFAWGLSAIRRLPAPIPAKGALSLWEWGGGPSQL